MPALPANVVTRGRNILAGALVLIGLAISASLAGDDFRTSEAWVSLVAGYGPLLLVLYFAFHGGGFSLGLIRFFLAIIAIGFVLGVANAIYRHEDGFTPGQVLAWRKLPIYLCLAFLEWAFFISPSVRAFISYRQGHGLRIASHCSNSILKAAK